MHIKVKISPGLTVENGNNVVNVNDGATEAENEAYVELGASVREVSSAEG